MYKLKLIEYYFKRLRFSFISDERYRISRFIRDFSFKPDVVNPKTFNEKIMYRMLSEHETLYTKLADKLLARDYIRQRACQQYLVPLLGVYNKVSDINFDKLPKQFVLKCNHDSGSVVICRDKNLFDIKSARKKLTYCLKRNMYYASREWQYKDIKPTILCEQYLDLSQELVSGYRPDVYRVHCFNGMPRYIELECLSSDGKRYAGIYDSEWKAQPVQIGHPNPTINFPKPHCLGELLKLASMLTDEIDYCRADFYILSNKIYFSEFTFAPSNGREKFIPQSWDLTFGNLWDLRKKTIL